MALLGGDVAGAAAPLDAAERASAAAADEIFEPSVGTAGSRLANVPAAIALALAFLVHLHGDAEGTVRYASRALAEINEGEWLQASEAR